MEFENGVQPVEATPDNTTVQAEQPTEIAIQDTPGGRKIVRVKAEQPQETPPEEAQPAQQSEGDNGTPSTEQPGNGPQEQEESEYTPEEIESASDVRTLDPNRIPEALKPMYKAMVKGMNAKFQEVAAERKVLEEVLQQVKTIQQPQPQFDPKQYFEQRHAHIASQVERAFGLEPGSYMYGVYPEQDQAYRFVERQLEESEKDTAKKQARQVEIQQFTQSVEMELRSADQEAYEYAMKKIENGEVLEKDKMAIVKALVDGDKKTVSEYFNKFRDEYRGVKKPPKTESKPVPKAPVLETAGQGPSAPQPAVSLDAPFLNKFRSASPQDKVRLISEWRRANQK